MLWSARSRRREVSHHCVSASGRLPTVRRWRMIRAAPAPSRRTPGNLRLLANRSGAMPQALRPLGKGGSLCRLCARVTGTVVRKEARRGRKGKTWAYREQQWLALRRVAQGSIHSSMILIEYS